MNEHQAAKAVAGCCMTAAGWLWHFVDAGARLFERIGPFLDGVSLLISITCGILTIHMLLKGRGNGRQG